ncbi:MAG TPA: biotin/lipoate A/B protein ligase family protein [Candidatus Kapabacteria bacterium]|nr:biotin/lipoate A/B protein ligase family protein [Candidatus Kapabacteria bacterium]
MSYSDWRIEEDFERTGAHHMARDEALTRERLENPSLPSLLRLYSWQPAAVSIGYQQRIESIDLEACQVNEVDVVRRPTGGRAVLHKNEITYAVITRASPADGLYAVHNRIVEALVMSISSLAPFNLEGSPLLVTPRSGGPEKNALPIACFASTARHEVTWRGKKVIGSAQRRFGEVVLQHGSILLTEDHLLLPDLLALSNDARQKMRDMLERETATLADVFGRPITIQVCAEAIRSNFVTNFLNATKVLADREITPSSFIIHNSSLPLG